MYFINTSRIPGATTLFTNSFFYFFLSHHDLLQLALILLGSEELGKQ
ncbi:hypothetical protein STRDD04_00979 [Streptococcus sp. DD04]|nr:hypothetical protein STRDD04_00979 [Streptococcus sp. DD04]